MGRQTRRFIARVRDGLVGENELKDERKRADELVRLVREKELTPNAVKAGQAAVETAIRTSGGTVVQVRQTIDLIEESIRVSGS